MLGKRVKHLNKNNFCLNIQLKYFRKILYVNCNIFSTRMFALYNLTQIFRKNSSHVIEEFSITPFSRIHRSYQSVRNIMVSFSIWILPTNASISLVPQRFNNITHCCKRGMHACKFATVFHQFRGYEPDALLLLPYRTMAAGYSVISIIEVNIFFPSSIYMYESVIKITKVFLKEFWQIEILSSLK